MSIPVIIYTTINHGIAITKLAKSLAVAWGAFCRGFHFIGDADAAIARALCASDALTCDVGDGAIFDARAVRANGFGGRAIGIGVALGGRRRRLIVGDARATRTDGLGSRAIGIGEAFGGWGDFASAVGATEGAQFERRSAGVDIAFE